MKQGRDLQQLAAEVLRQHESKRDFIADSTAVRMEDDGRTLTIADKRAGTEDSDFNRLMAKPVNPALFAGQLTDFAARQLATKLDIPQRYYDRMANEQPDLLAYNVNKWFDANPKKRMLRTLDGNVRAVLSSNYRPMDNWDLCQAWLPQVKEMELEIVSCEITDMRLYFKALNKRLFDEVKKGDIVQAGICISNSEVGQGRVLIEPLVYRLSCLNGAISADYSLRKTHLGRQHTVNEDSAREFFTDETRQADDKAFWLKVRDTVAGTFNDQKFKAIVRRWAEATEQEITGDPVKVVEVAAKEYQLAENEQGDVLKHLIKEGDLTQYGLANAITRASQDVENYDRATELERLGGQVIELPKSDWVKLNEAA